MKNLKKALAALLLLAAVSTPLSAEPIAVDTCIKMGWACDQL